jgi:hypothetical protein
MLQLIMFCFVLDMILITIYCDLVSCSSFFPELKDEQIS